MTTRPELARLAEEIAARALVARRWAILDRNWRAGHREIDIVARRAATVAFVEVRARSSDRFGHPILTISRAKQRDVGHAARQWIARHGRPGDSYRFDVVTVLAPPGAEPTAEYWPDAWRP